MSRAAAALCLLALVSPPAQAQEPDDVQAALNEASAHLEAGEPAKAWEVLAAALERHDDAAARPLLLRERARIQLHRGREEAARRDLDEALELDPRDGWAYYLRAKVQTRLEAFEGALRDLDHAVDADPDQAERLELRARVHQELGRDEEALRDVSAALRLDPSSARYALRADLRLGLDDLEGARADLDAALEAKPGDEELLFRRSLVARVQGDAAGERRDLERVVELAPAHPRAGARLKALRHRRRDERIAAASALAFVLLLGGVLALGRLSRTQARPTAGAG